MLDVSKHAAFAQVRIGSQLMRIKHRSRGHPGTLYRGHGFRLAALAGPLRNHGVDLLAMRSARFSIDIAWIARKIFAASAACWGKMYSGSRTHSPRSVS